MKAFIIFLILTVSTFGFQKGDKVQILVNKIAPYANPTQSFKYYTLPFCQPKEALEEYQTLGENLSGNRKMNSLYKAEFNVNNNHQEICQKKMSKSDIEAFQDAIANKYVFDMYVNDIVVGNVVGFVKNDQYYLVKHLNFNVYYNKQTNNIIKAHIDFDQFKDVEQITDKNKEYNIKFSYSIQWRETEQSKTDINVGNDSYFADEIHWFSFLNAFFLVIFLIILVWMILQRISKTDSGNVPNNDLEDDKRDDDMKWKLIRIEVFKCPPQRNILSALVGSGFHLTIVVLALLLLGVMGMYYQHKGSVYAAGVFLYALTSVVGGAISSRFYKYLGGTHWAVNILVTTMLFPLPLFIIAMTLNNIAWASDATSAFPFSAVFFIIFLWGVVTLPLTIIGGIAGRTRMDETLVDVGYRLPKMAKKVPELPLYLGVGFTAVIAGLLPFSATHVELYYIFSSFWGHKVYTMYGMLFMVFVMLLNMTACISIILTYFQLNALDYRWWWRSFLNGASSGVYAFIYAIYFFYQKTEMHGFLQTMYFFGYSFLFSAAVSIIFGGISFLASMAFVKHLYEKTKII